MSMITLGIDIGTSGVKVALVGDDDRVIGHSSQPLNVSRPHAGWSEQAPDDWWAATCAGLDELIEKILLQAELLVVLLHRLILRSSTYRAASAWDGRAAGEVFGARSYNPACAPGSDATRQ